MTRLRIFLVHHRRTLATTCAFIGTLLVLNTVIPALIGKGSVVIATRDIQAGATLTEDDLRVMRIPDALMWIDAIHGVHEAAGHTTFEPLAKGQPLSKHVIQTINDLGLSDNERAVALTVQSMPDGLHAGLHVDVYSNSGLLAPDVVIVSLNSAGSSNMFTRREQAHSVLVSTTTNFVGALTSANQEAISLVLRPQN